MKAVEIKAKYPQELIKLVIRIKKAQMVGETNGTRSELDRKTH